MKTDEDDEFDRIDHEAKIRSGQPYLGDVFVSPSQKNHVLEEVAQEFDKMKAFGDTGQSFATFVRNMKVCPPCYGNCNQGRTCPARDKCLISL